MDKNDVVRAVGLKFLGVHQFIYERSGGRIGHRMLGIPCLLLRTTGREVRPAADQRAELRQ